MAAHTGLAVVCIDLQAAILAGLAGAEQARVDLALEALLPRVRALQDAARAQGAAVVHVQHDGAAGHRLARGSAGWRLREEVGPLAGETVVHQATCNAFWGSSLETALRALGVRTLVVAGCMTQFCVDTTCRSAVERGFDVRLVADGHLNAGSAGLSFEQVIAHHNALLDGFGAGGRSVRVLGSKDAL